MDVTVPPSAKEIFVPGRVCLLGEHSDWAGQHELSEGEGKCLVYNTDVGIHAYTWANDENKLLFIEQAADGNLIQFSSALDSRVLREYAMNPDEYFAYVCGTVAVMLEKYATSCPKNRGLVIYNDLTSVPMRKGFSSSAAVCVLVVKAFCQMMLDDVTMTVDEEMDLAFQGERATPSQCGRMDQCVAFGPQAVISMRFFRKSEVNAIGVSHSALKVKSGYSFYFAVADLCKGKDTQVILSDLQDAYSSNAQNSVSSSADIDTIATKEWPESVLSLFKLITSSVNPTDNIRTFLSAENDALTAMAQKALEDGQPEVLGATMALYQQRFDSCMGKWSSELTAHKLHRVMFNVGNLKGLTYGGKGVGSQGDGSVQFVCTSPAAQDELIDYLTRVEECHAFKFTVTGH